MLFASTLDKGVQMFTPGTRCSSIRALKTPTGGSIGGQDHTLCDPQMFACICRVGHNTVYIGSGLCYVLLMVGNVKKKNNPGVDGGECKKNNNRCSTNY